MPTPKVFACSRSDVGVGKWILFSYVVLLLPIPTENFARPCKKNAEMFFTEGNEENEDSCWNLLNRTSAREQRFYSAQTWKTSFPSLASGEPCLTRSPRLFL